MELSRFTPIGGSTNMEANKHPEPKAEFSDSKSYNFVGKKFPRQKTKITVIIILVVVLLLGAVISISLYFALRKTAKTASTRLVEVKLDKGETLAYKVDQQIEIQGNGAQKANIGAIVGIQVLNKTSEEYWFLVKFNLSLLNGNMDLRNIKKEKAFFLIRLQIDLRTPKDQPKKTTESFDVYGHSHNNQEFLRLVYNILKQLLPTVQYDLFEDVDGEKSDSLVPEESPLLPGPVKMHRKADTSDENSVSIKNHFSSEDFQDLPTEIDLDLKYSDHAVIDKSKGVITESNFNFTQQLNLGEPIHNKSGVKVSLMKVTLTSHISLINREFKDLMDTEKVRFPFFVKLVVPKNKVTFALHDRPSGVFNSSQTPLNVFSPSRSRRAADYVPWREVGSSNFDFEHPFTLFEKKMVGIDIKGEGMIWIHDEEDMEIGVSFGLSIAGRTLPDIIYRRYRRSEMEDGQSGKIEHRWSKALSISVPVLILRIGVEFSLSFEVSSQLRFPWDQNSVNPVRLTAKINPSAEVTASIEGYVSAYFIRGGAYGDGTLVRVGLPVMLSYRDNRDPGHKWCVDLSVRLTALELSAGLFYQWRHWWHWGTRHTLYEFGKWDAIQRNWKELERCS